MSGLTMYFDFLEFRHHAEREAACEKMFDAMSESDFPGISYGSDEDISIYKVEFNDEESGLDFFMRYDGVCSVAKPLRDYWDKQGFSPVKRSPGGCLLPRLFYPHDY